MAEEVIKIDISGLVNEAMGSLDSVSPQEVNRALEQGVANDPKLQAELDKLRREEIREEQKAIQFAIAWRKEEENQKKASLKDAIAKEQRNTADIDAQAKASLARKRDFEAAIKSQESEELEAAKKKAALAKESADFQAVIARERANMFREQARLEKEEAASAKSKLTEADNNDLQKLIRQNKRLYNEEMSRPKNEQPEEPQNEVSKLGVAGAFLQKIGSGLAGHHGGIRSLLGGAAKGLGGAIGGGAGGAGGAGGGALAGAAAGAPLGPLGIAAGVVIGKIAGDAIGQASQLLYDGAKLIYNSGEKFTEQGSQYSSVLLAATQDRQMKEMRFAMGLDNSSGSLSRFYTSQTNMQIEMQTALLKLFETVEPAISLGVLTLTDMLTIINATHETLKMLLEKNQGALGGIMGVLTGAAGGMAVEAARKRLEEASKEAKKNQGIALQGMADFLGFGNDFKGGKAGFQGAADYMPKNINQFNNAMGF